MASSRRRKQNHIHVYVVLFASAFLMFLAFITGGRASTEKVDLNAWFASSDGNMAVVTNGVLSHEDLVTENGKVYASVSYVIGKLNTRFYYDEQEELLLYSLPDKTETVNLYGERNGVRILKKGRDAMYVLLDYIADFTNLSWDYYPDPERLVLRTDFSDRQEILVTDKVAVRKGAGVRNPILDYLEVGENAAVLEASSDWMHICTTDGISGYIAREDVASVKTVSSEDVYTEPEYVMVSTEQNVCLVWHLVGSQEDNENLETLLGDTVGVTAVSPTWFHLTDGEGHFTSLASSEYVEKAHARDLQVWALINNMDNEVYGDALTSLLSSTSKRKKLVHELVQAVMNVGADGINLDLESVPSAAGSGYIQLIRELSLACHANGLVLSVDNYVPSAWTNHYRRDEQGIFADYVIIMGYDEHYKGSEAGSTASLPFVVQGVQDTLKQVPADKVINAVPLYTRLWKGSGSSLSSTSLTMKAQQALIEEKGLTLIWDEELGQNYIEYTVEEIPHRIWVEDAESAAARLEALRKYELAGVAAWVLGNETKDVWPIIGEYLGNAGN